MNNYRGMKAYFIIFIILLMSISTRAFGQGIPEEARRFMSRGMAAVEMAKTPKDYERAVSEFEQAQKLAPDWPEVYFNLGSVQAKAGNYSEAMRNYKRYLELAPNAPDAANVRDEIYKLEYRAEQQAKVPGLGGIWKNKDSRTEYRVAVTPGNIFEANNKNGVKIRGVMNGLSFAGVITIPGDVEDGNGCVTPDQDLECLITIGEDNNTITVNYTYYDFIMDETPPGLFSRRTCSNVRRNNSHPDIIVLVR
ncbi:MAG TPA: tetratricopeptide repeat protein [Terracidiphilus sp.]|jgi:tetratricopeptide (TPR) repeat protein